tara:strand:- start:88 stop:1176 length:1089 start_codon:yes stop_codon:yes gene_type:complete
VIEAKSNLEKSDEDFVNIVLFNDQINDIEKNIQHIVSNKDEVDYYANTADILYNYYDLVENNSDTSMNITNHLNAVNTNKTKSILEYFHKKPNDSKEKSNDCNSKMSDSISLSSKSNDVNRASLLDEYLSITDKDYINDNIDNNIALKCEHCQSMEKTVLNNDSISVCNNCFSVQHLLTDNEKPSYKDPPKEISYFSYKRINHYQEWLNQIQGKETTDIPEEIFDKIMLELKKQRITNVKDINRQKIKDILKKLKINKYYEHIPYILNRITGIPNPNLTPELEEKLRNMFKEIQVPFLKHSPLVRKNFLSYSYVIHKFIQILGKDEYLKYFPLLKSREKLHQQEEIWKKICKDLGWKFIRSI